MLRIAIVAPHFAEYATRLASALSDHAEVLLVREARDKAMACEGLSVAANGRRLAHVDYEADLVLQRFLPRGMLAARCVRRAVAAFRPDVIHIQEQGDAFTVSLARAFRGVCPIALTVHDPVPHSGRDAEVAARFAAGLTELRAAASAYHVHGAHCEALLRSRVPGGRPILSTNHGIALVPSRPAPAEGGRRYLFFGRMEAYKGLETLLDAVAMIAPASGMRFVLAGKGPELDRHRDRISRMPSIEVIEGFLTPLDAIRQFQSARAVLAPYNDATQSGVVSAAIGNGRPVIASDVGGLRDALRSSDSGLLVPPRDAPALAAAIEAMAEDALCRRLSANATAAAATGFSWQAIASSLLAFYAGAGGPLVAR